MAAEKTTAVTKKEGCFDIVPLTNDIRDIINEELDGLGSLSFDMVKIPSGGGLAFEVPGDDPENPQTVTEIVGIILDHHAVNAYWEEKYDGSNESPDCSSMDGKSGVIIETGETRSCDGCPFNQFGSADDGKGKACKNMHRIYLLQEGEQLPILLSLPPTSLGALRDYLAKRVVLKGKRSYQVITKITLKKETSSGGIKYSKAVFQKVGDLTAEQCAAVAPSVDTIRAIARRVPIVDEVYNPYVEGGNGNFAEVDEI